MVAALALTARDRKVRRVLAGTDRIAEGQRIGAGAAGIGGHTAVIERQRRRAAGDCHRLSKVECQGYCAAGIEVASSGSDPRSDATTDDTVGAVVSICGLPWARPTSDRLAALPAPSVMVAALRLTAVVIRSGVF